MTGRLRTPSLRTRAVLVVLLVMLVVIAGLVIIVDRTFAVQADRSIDQLVTARAQLARQLARSGTGPQQLVNRLDGGGVRAGLLLQDGRTYGEPLPVRGTDVRTIQLTAPAAVDGATLQLAVDKASLDKTQRALRRSLLIAGLAALVLAVALILLVMRFALRPLDAFAALARDVTSGHRGSRLRPSRTDTELGRAALAVDAMLDELESAERRSQEFLADAAHELRTPAAGIAAAAEALLHQADSLSDHERDQLLVLLVREAHRTGRLTDDLLAASRLDAGVTAERIPVDLAELTAGEVARTELVHPSIAFRLDIGAQPQLLSDPVKLRSIVSNVLGNAVKAVGPTGHIAVSVTESPQWASVLITDDGPGVPEAERAHIFERLVRLDADRSRASGSGGGPEGAGLGLAIARGYARVLGGELSCIEPPPGTAGAAFLLVLPTTGRSH